MPGDAAASDPLPSRARFALWSLILLVLHTYSSTLVGPIGTHYVPIDPAVALHRLLAITWVRHGSDQRADWMANLVALIPAGLLMAGAVWPRPGEAWHGTPGRIAAGAAAFALALPCILGIKYLQLFFPPRTVTLNYVVAQSAGALIGIALFNPVAGALRRVAAMRRQGGARAGNAVIVACLCTYALLLAAVTLSPFDIVLSAGDVRERLASLPQTLFSLPGGGRPALVRVVLIAAASAAFAPLGVLAAHWRPRFSWAWMTACALAVAAGLTALSMTVLGASPSLFSIPLRALGMLAGAGGLRLLGRGRLRPLAPLLPVAAPLLAAPYVLLLLAGNGLLSRHWQGLGAALADTDPRIFLPGFLWYIVTKAVATASLAFHLVMYAPVGVLVWMRAGDGPGPRRAAPLLGAALCLLVEFGRLLHPGTHPDFNMIVVAAAAAAIAHRAVGLPWLAFAAGPAAAPAQETQPTQAPEPPARPAPAPPPPHPPAPRPSLAAATISSACLGLILWALARYPLGPLALGAALALYAAALWRWPGLWLVVVPAVLPALDLAPWTGWFFVAESDLFVLASIGILVLRAPPRRADLWPRGLNARLAGAVLGLAALATLAGIARAYMLRGDGPALTALPYLMPANAWRLAKPLATVLALLPFLRARLRSRGDGFVLAAWGMVAGLFPVALAALLERSMFDGAFNFTADYRVVATFASMHVGGGHIGAYVAMTLPFLAVCVRRRAAPRPGALALLLAGLLAGGYTLAVSFARMAYGAAAIGSLVLALLWLRSGGRRWLVPLVFVLGLGGSLAGIAFGTSFMDQRLSRTLPDLSFRVANWRNGLAMRDASLAGTLFGTGLGSYGRVAFTHAGPEFNPPNFMLGTVAGRTALIPDAASSLYIGQKIRLPRTGPLTIQADLYADTPPAAASFILCRKLLLYSEGCRTVTLSASQPGHWNTVAGPIGIAGLARPLLHGLLEAPVELAVVTPRGRLVAVSGIRLLAPDGTNLIANGDFSRGTERWYFTSDDHTRWRIFNQYLMTLFETGLLGLAAFLALAAAGAAGGVRALGQGDRLGAAVAASIAAFLCSSLVDALLEAPQLATLFLFVCGMGITMLTRPLGDVHDA